MYLRTSFWLRHRHQKSENNSDRAVETSAKKCKKVQKVQKMAQSEKCTKKKCKKVHLHFPPAPVLGLALKYLGQHLAQPKFLGRAHTELMSTVTADLASDQQQPRRCASAMSWSEGDKQGHGILSNRTPHNTSVSIPSTYQSSTTQHPPKKKHPPPPSKGKGPKKGPTHPPTPSTPPPQEIFPTTQWPAHRPGCGGRGTGGSPLECPAAMGTESHSIGCRKN